MRFTFCCSFVQANVFSFASSVGWSLTSSRNQGMPRKKPPAADVVASHCPSHDGRGLFSGLPEPVEVGRYHSLAATVVPDALDVSARSDDGEIMAVRHRELPVDGLQFHPESVLTPLGSEFARNFLGRR